MISSSQCIEIYTELCVNSKSIYIPDITYGSSSSFKFNLGNDSSTSHITGTEFLSDGSLLLCDYHNRRMKLFCSDFTMIDSFKLWSGPRDDSSVKSSTVIITLPWSNLLQCIHMVPYFKLGSKLQLDKKCLVLMYRKNSKIWDTSNNCHNFPKNRKV